MKNRVRNRKAEVDAQKMFQNADQKMPSDRKLKLKADDENSIAGYGFYEKSNDGTSPKAAGSIDHDIPSGNRFESCIQPEAAQNGETNRSADSSRFLPLITRKRKSAQGQRINLIYDAMQQNISQNEKELTAI